MAGVLKQGVDPLALIEALYAPHDSDAWMTAVLAETKPLLVAEHGLALLVVAHNDDYANPTVTAGVSTFALSSADVGSVLGAMPPELFRLLYYPGLPALTQTELEQNTSAASTTALQQLRASIHIGDAVGVFAYPEPGVACVLSAGLSRAHRLSDAERRLLARISGHLDSALRLRSRPEQTIAAVLSPQGRFLDLADQSLARARREWFGAQIAAIDSSRRKRQRPSFDDDPWWALFHGRYSVVPRQDRDGKRYYLLVENSPRAEPHARLSTREIEVLRSAARGFTNKSIAYNLGISFGAVSNALRSASGKLGLRSRVDLLRVAAAMFGVRSDTVDLATLTSAEREILALLQRGLSNAEIASRRARSPNTIKNQIAALLRKTRSPSRRALSLLDK